MARIHGNGSDAIRDSMEKTARQVSDQAESMFQSVKGAASDYSEKVGGFVKEHPLPAILTGLGIGFLIGRLLSR